MQAEDVDAVLRGGGDEPARKVGVDGSRADEEAPPQREPERRPHTRLQRADPLPGALEPPFDRGVEAPAAGDLEVGEARAVENPREPQLLRRRHDARERLLPEQADRRIGQGRHRAGPYRAFGDH